jgi:hypothetical protein
MALQWIGYIDACICDKKTGRITNIQVEDNIRGRQHSLPFAVYLARGIEPDHRTLPWQEDIKETPARPVSNS